MHTGAVQPQRRERQDRRSFRTTGTRHARAAVSPGIVRRAVEAHQLFLAGRRRDPVPRGIAGNAIANPIPATARTAVNATLFNWLIEFSSFRFRRGTTRPMVD